MAKPVSTVSKRTAFLDAVSRLRARKPKRAPPSLFAPCFFPVIQFPRKSWKSLLFLSNCSIAFDRFPLFSPKSFRVFQKILYSQCRCPAGRERNRRSATNLSRAPNSRPPTRAIRSLVLMKLSGANSITRQTAAGALGKGQHVEARHLVGIFRMFRVTRSLDVGMVGAQGLEPRTR